MPMKDPSSHPGDTRTREVRLLATSTNALWIADRDLEWLVVCLTDEYLIGGVPLDEPAVAVQVAEGDCKAQA